MEPENQYQRNIQLNKEIRRDAFQLLVAIFFIATLIAGGGVLKQQRLAEASVNNSSEFNKSNIAAAAAAGIDMNTVFQATQKCLETGSQTCKNKCATTYVDIQGTLMHTLDCYASEDEHAPAKVVDALYQCIRWNSRITANNGGNDTINEQTREDIKQTLCISDESVKITDGTFKLETASGGNGTSQNSKTIIVPQECEKELNDVLTLRSESQVQSSATRAERNVCANKGPVVCYPTDFLNPESGYRCIFKDAVQSGLVTVGGSGTVVNSKKTDTSCKNGNLAQRAQCQVSKVWDSRLNLSAGLAIGQSIGQGLSSLLFGSDGSSDTTSQVASKQLQCHIYANKISISSGEEVTIRWQSENATKASITGIGTSVSQTGQKTVTPVESTTYTMTATGSNGATKNCDVTVTVDGKGVGGATGVAPPQLACTPNPVSKGGESTIRWACTTAADRSVGEGIDTSGATSGSTTVSPDFNQEYGVTCYKDDIAIGKNTCSIAVGESLYDIIVYPTEAKRGERVRISWSGLFMNSCRVQGPRGFDYTNTQGVVTTEPFSVSEDTVSEQNLRSAVYTLECQTQFGTTVTKDASVNFVAE